MESRLIDNESACVAIADSTPDEETRAAARGQKLREAGRLIAEAIQDAMRDPWVLRNREGQLDMVARCMFTMATAYATGGLCEDSDDKRDFIAGQAIREHGCVR